MPLPIPRKDEEKNDFISRCMEDDVMREEFKDLNQRLAVCYSQWNRYRESKVFKWEKFYKILRKASNFAKIRVEEGDKYWRVRVKDPEYFDEKSFKIIDISKDGKIRAIIGCKKGKFKNGICQIGTEVQSYLFAKDAFTAEEAKKWVEEHI